MRHSVSIFSSGAVAGRRSADLQLAWMDAADDAHEAYIDWCASDRADAADAYAVYDAALDREEAAARAMQLELKQPSLNFKRG
jgi:hypothetical protein